MKTLTWVDITRKSIKSKLGFGWSISGWERNNKLITKVVYRYQNGSRNSILVDLNWSSDNRKKMIDIIDELAAKRDGGFIDWGYLLSRVDPF